MKVLMCYPQACAPATAVSAHQVNGICQVNFAHGATHEEAALMHLKSLCACPEISVVKKIALNILNRVLSYALIATTGSILAAMAAGTIPETSPIAVDTPRPRTMFLIVNVTIKLPIGMNVTR